MLEISSRCHEWAWHLAWQRCVDGLDCVDAWFMTYTNYMCVCACMCISINIHIFCRLELQFKKISKSHYTSFTTQVNILLLYYIFMLWVVWAWYWLLYFWSNHIVLFRGGHTCCPPPFQFVLLWEAYTKAHVPTLQNKCKKTRQNKRNNSFLFQQ